jgi:glycosyltransferase involved in cell wall biosynthesis
MKKLVCAHLLNDFSGSPKVLSQVINLVSESNYEVDLYAGNASEGFLSKTAANTFTYRYNLSNNKFFTLMSFFSSQIILFFILFKYFKKDVVFYVNTMLPFGASLAALLMRKTVIYHIHEISIKPLILKKFLRLIIKLTADKIIYVSKAVKLSEHFKNKTEYVVYNSLDSSFLKQAENKKIKIRDNFNVLMVCSLKEYKGVNEFIEASRRIKSYTHITFTLVLNANDQEVESYFKNITVPKSVSLFSSQNDIAHFYNSTDLLLNLSHVDRWIETFGLTIIEAMAYGIPVIVPPVGGPAEIVTNNKEGYLISSKNIDEIAEKIIFLSKNHDTLLRLSKNALKRSKYFSEKKFQEGILKVLNS